MRFLERFPITFEQKYPSVKIETKIISKMLETENAKDDEYATNLVNWATLSEKLILKWLMKSYLLED